jgi:signal transduction histidine kinase
MRLDYPSAMTAVPSNPPLRGITPVLSWRRVRFVLVFTFILGSMIGLGWSSGYWSALVRVIAIGLFATLVFGLSERWPARLPACIPRWVWQVVGVAGSIPVVTFAIYVLSTDAGGPHFWQVPDRLSGFSMLTGLGMFLSPWIALAALVRQKDALAREQALALELVQSEARRRALDARLNLLQAQVAPHFLFNTLANVQALVDSGSPKAPEVLRSLVAYLRAAVPRLDEPAATLRRELQLVRAYLDLMRMRMPDRLRFEIQADDAALGLRCPPMTLLTLVENAVRHGIDPSEEGGRIDIRARREDGRCRITVRDDGAGLQPDSQGLGTGLAALRERLQLMFGEAATLRISARQPLGVLAEVEFPAQEAPE